MRVFRPTRTSRLLLALACCLAVLGPAGAAAGQAAAGSGARALAEAADGPGQALLRDPLAGPRAGPGSRRDDRELPGPALPALLAPAVVQAGAWAAARRAVRPARRLAAAAPGARAPPGAPAAPI